MKHRRAKSRVLIALVVFTYSLITLSAAQKKLPSEHVPAGIARGKIAPAGHLAGTNELRLAIGLPLHHADALTNLLREIYDPASPQFHHYLTPAEFTARFGPTPEEYAAVARFAKENGFKVVGTHPNRQLLDVVAKAADVERAFHVRLNTFKHPKENRNFFAPDTEPSVDASLPVLHISGLDNFYVPHPNVTVRPAVADSKATPQGGSGPGSGYIGADFRKAYIPETQLTGAGQNIGLLQFDGFYRVDMTNYASTIGLARMPQIIVVPIDGGVATPGAGVVEVSLDIEMAMAMAPGVSNIYVYEAPNPSPWVDLLGQMADDNLARQLSCSWGGGGPHAAAEQIFQQMAAQGQTFFNATGDSDAFTGAILFPSESPNITQVGGTSLTTDGNGNYTNETVWNQGNGQGSSGGISTTVPIPDWQTNIDMTTNQGSTTMRNVPDVALTAQNIYLIYGNGSSGMASGTSCSAPLWAGFIALLNEQAATASKPPAGFINPAVYAL
ncbi:MAG: S8/S53 family peptidase, partial [Verrucomicrobia bacterium]|nr:S8/S53 family peptidase [Verrucomicrobiota bacterium]